jgi:hypothetical protein
MNLSIKKTNTKIGIIGIIIIVVVLVAVGSVLIYGAQEPEVVVFDNRVQIKAMYGLTIDFSDITDISLIENSMSEMDVGRRVWGSDIFGTLQGHFKSDTLGETLLFIRLNSAPTLRIERNNDKDIYLSFSNSEKTNMLFDELNTAIDRDNNIKK